MAINNGKCYVLEQPLNGKIIRTQTSITVYSQMTELEQHRMNEPAQGLTRQHKFVYKCSRLRLIYSTDYTTVLHTNLVGYLFTYPWRRTILCLTCAGGRTSHNAREVELPKLSDEDCARFWRVSTSARLCAGNSLAHKGICPVRMVAGVTLSLYVDGIHTATR